MLIGLRGTENASAPHSMNESNYKPYIIVRARIWTKGLAVIKESNTNNLWKNGSMYDHNFPPKSPVSTSHHQIYEWPPAMLYSSLLEGIPTRKKRQGLINPLYMLRLLKFIVGSRRSLAIWPATGTRCVHLESSPHTSALGFPVWRSPRCTLQQNEGLSCQHINADVLTQAFTFEEGNQLQAKNPSIHKVHS